MASKFPTTQLNHPLPGAPGSKMTPLKKGKALGAAMLHEKLFKVVTKLGKQKKTFKGVKVAGD
jgi:hypothetical protein